MAVAVTWEGAHTACSSRRFADLLSAPGTYPSLQACIAAAERIWWNEIGVEGWLEAFAAHPEIGDAGETHDLIVKQPLADSRYEMLYAPRYQRTRLHSATWLQCSETCDMGNTYFSCPGTLAQQAPAAWSQRHDSKMAFLPAQHCPFRVLQLPWKRGSAVEVRLLLASSAKKSRQLHWQPPTNR